MINEGETTNEIEEISIVTRHGSELPQSRPILPSPTTENSGDCDESRMPDHSTILSQGDGGDSNSNCTICMEEWTIGSEHRLCCLKCGHLFGRSCIERWIKEKGQQARCPTCNKPAKKIDIRDLWCKAIKASDNTELKGLQNLLEKERKDRKADSAIIFHSRMRIDVLSKDVENLKLIIIERDRKIAKLEAVIKRMHQLSIQRSAEGKTGAIDVAEAERLAMEDEEVMAIDVNIQPSEIKGKFYFAEKLDCSSTGGCKSLTVFPASSDILVAQPAPASSHAGNVFGAHGLRKYNLLDTSVREFIPLHSKAITSIQLKPLSELILTSGQDKKIKITSIINNTCVLSYQTLHEPVCVVWSSNRDQQFYVGSANCYVTLYDMRNTSDYIYQTSRRVANTRLLSLASVSQSQNDGATLNGILVNDSRGSQFMEITDSSGYESEMIDREVEHLTSNAMPFDGLMGTVDFHKPTELSLVSTRRSPQSSNITHNLIKLKQSNNPGAGSSRVECERVKTFNGGRPPELLSQSRILSHPTLDQNVLVGAFDDSAKGVKLWDASDDTVFQSIKTNVFVRDMIKYTPENTNQHYLLTLGERILNIYRWDYA